MARQLYKKKGGKSTGGKEVQQEEVEQQPQPTEQQEEAPSQVEESAQLQQAVSVEAVDEVLPKRPVALAELPLHVIIPSRAQAREEESLTPASLEGLVASMQEHGILSRIRVRQIASESDEEERFELVFGERRWRAARLAGFTHYPVEIAQYTDDELEEVGLVENLQRQDLTPLEEARKFERLLTLQDESGQPKYSIRKLATRIGKDKSYIEMRLAVLRGEDLQELARIQPDVPLRIVYEISKVEDKEKREDLITEVREGGLKKVEEVKTRVREATGRTKNVLAPSSTPSSVTAPERQETGAPETSMQTPQLAEQGEAQSEQQTSVKKSSLAMINASVSSSQALVLFEQQLQEDNIALMDILHRLTTDLEAMTPAQREVLIVYIDRWGKTLMDLKSHARGMQDHL